VRKNPGTSLPGEAANTGVKPPTDKAKIIRKNVFI
jgi:hypothetical protein